MVKALTELEVTSMMAGDWLILASQLSRPMNRA